MDDRACGVAVKEERGAGPAAFFVLRDNPAMREMGICGFVGRRDWIDGPFSAYATGSLSSSPVSSSSTESLLISDFPVILVRSLRWFPIGDCGEKRLW
jgi:hypothetical protein